LDVLRVGDVWRRFKINSSIHATRGDGVSVVYKQKNVAGHFETLFSTVGVTDSD
jgi:hypothetical protein